MSHSMGPTEFVKYNYVSNITIAKSSTLETAFNVLLYYSICSFI